MRKFIHNRVAVAGKVETTNIPKQKQKNEL